MNTYSSRNYRTIPRHHRNPDRKRKRLLIIAALLLIAGVFAVYKLFLTSDPVERAASQLQFDGSVTEAEKQTITDAIRNQAKTYDGDVTAGVQTSMSAEETSRLLEVYVPVTNKYATRQTISKDEVAQTEVYLPQSMDVTAKVAVGALFGLDVEKLMPLEGSAENLSADAIAFIPAGELSPNVKLLALDGAYYLDTFKKGALFRQAVFNGGNTEGLSGLTLNNLPNKDKTLKVNMTGVTALTRKMMQKLQSVGDATYFSEKIGDFLADADITHVSNEVSFKEGCSYSAAVFCSPPEMIDTLKDSGVDLVEITGNHNNDVGSEYNTGTIQLYQELGWHTFGGGLNSEEAAKPYIANIKGNKVAFLGYNFADSPNGGAISGSSKAGANAWDAAKVQADIASAKEQANFVIVDIQFWECYAYPDGYIEFPECDLPIGQQKDVFRQAADYGADMVVGSSAHQPQTYEIYNGVPIYYGLGNMYFEQTLWPGTERGIILTNYFVGGKLLQTRLSPTVYDEALQTQLMNNEDAVYLLDRLNTARQAAGL